MFEDLLEYLDEQVVELSGAYGLLAMEKTDVGAFQSQSWKKGKSVGAIGTSGKGQYGRGRGASTSSQTGPSHSSQKGPSALPQQGACEYCQTGLHPLFKYEKFISADLDERWRFVKATMRCFCCIVYITQGSYSFVWSLVYCLMCFRSSPFLWGSDCFDFYCEFCFAS